MSEEKWAFTFPFKDEERRNKYVVYIGTWQEARRAICTEFSQEWAFQYPWEEFQEQITSFGLTELEAIEESLEGVPFIAIGNDELGAELGKTIKCPHCSKEHDIKNSTSKDPITGEQVPSNMLQFYKCGETTYLAGIKGKRVR